MSIEVHEAHLKMLPRRLGQELGADEDAQALCHPTHELRARGDGI